MSTRSNIGVLNSDGSVDMIYCHWDGYPENNGKILLESYTDLKKIRRLIKLGNVSSLGPELGTKHPFDFDYTLGFDSPEYEAFRNQCNFYGRDRGEKGQGPCHYPNVEQAVEAYRGGWCEFFYLFQNGKWTYMEGKAPFRALTPARCKA